MKTIRIGTRDSQLALWQAETVADLLTKQGCKTEIVKVKSQGDIILDKPLYELGITGIFTKNLDIALLQNQIDIAVHSMKDVPTSLAKGIVQTAVLERAAFNDMLVYNNSTDFLSEQNAVIATGSLRRKAQWLNKFPTHQITDLRGNINTRLQKVIDNNWNGAIFAQAGLERITVKPQNAIVLDWMIPAPSQGAIMVVARAEDTYCIEQTSKINHTNTAICTFVEKEFLRVLEGGCTAPIGALATIENEQINFVGVLLTIDGTQRIEVRKSTHISDYQNLGKEAALEVKSKANFKIGS